MSLRTTTAITFTNALIPICSPNPRQIKKKLPASEKLKDSMPSTLTWWKTPSPNYSRECGIISNSQITTPSQPVISLKCTRNTLNKTAKDTGWGICKLVWRESDIVSIVHRLDTYTYCVRTSRYTKLTTFASSHTASYNIPHPVPCRSSQCDCDTLLSWLQ